MRVQCPNCKRRMFDIVRAGDAEIVVKCHSCGRIISCELDLPKGRITIEGMPQPNNTQVIIVTEQRALK